MSSSPGQPGPALALAQARLPRWYWWSLALGWIALGFLSDLGHQRITLDATLAFGAAHSTVAPRVLSGGHRTHDLSVSADIAGHQAPRLVIAGLLLIVGLTIAGALAADADGARRPATLASIVVAVIVLLGGPRLRALVRRGDASPHAPMTAARFDEVIHPSTRLSIVALLAAADWVEFAFVRDQLGLSDSALSKQLSTLEDAAYVTIQRPVSDRRRRVRAQLTPAGAGGLPKDTSRLCARSWRAPIRRVPLR